MPWKSKENRDRYRLQYAQDHPEKLMWTSAKCRAKRNGIDFSIDALVIKLVATTGKRPSWSSPTLDRRDNTKGYIKGNIAVISHKANACKSDLTKEQIRSLWRYVYE